MSLSKLIVSTLLVSGAVGAGAPAEAHERPQPRAITLWWVIFNEPEACITSPQAEEKCGALDLFGQAYLDSVARGDPDPTVIVPNLASEPAVIYATGGRTNRRGRLEMFASIYRSAGPLQLGPGIVDPLGLQRGFEKTDAEIHLVVRDHGPVVREGFLEQATGFLDPYCGDPALKVPGGPNICQDVQFAIFAASEAGEDAVYDVSGEQVRRASAVLLRNGDMVQAYIETRVRTSR